jgi:hypothetical protein
MQNLNSATLEYTCATSATASIAAHSWQGDAEKLLDSWMLVPHVSAPGAKVEHDPDSICINPMQALLQRLVRACALSYRVVPYGGECSESR